MTSIQGTFLNARFYFYYIYYIIFQVVSIIHNKLGNLKASQDALGLLTETYRNEAVDTFVKALNENLPKLLGI